MNQDWTLLEISFTTESAEQQATEMEKHEEHNINKVLPSKNDHKQQNKATIKLESRMKKS